MRARLLSIAVLALAVLSLPLVAQPGQTPGAAPGTANPELVGALASELGSTPQQAEGAAGAMFGLAKSRLKADDWSKVAGAVPGMDGLLKAAPPVGTSGSALPGALGSAAGLGGLASLAGSFSNLGLKPDLVSKAVPILTQYVGKTGGAGVSNLLAGALK